MKPAVGVTESMLTRLDAVLDDGPVSVDESVTELAASVSPTVPSVVHATETVKLGDAPVIEGVPHAAVPWTLRSGVDKPVIASLKRRVKLTVRDVEERVKLAGGKIDEEKPQSGSTSATRTDAVRPAALLELEDLLSDHLDTRVQVAMGARKGRIVIEFARLEDLERIYRVMVDGKSAAE